MEFEFADPFKIAAFEEIAIAFFQDILEMDYFGILITDESALSDFVGCGEECTEFPPELDHPSLTTNERRELWRKWVGRRISCRYGIEIPDVRIYLVDLFRQIKSAKKPIVQ